jgi:hypothetical protein
MSIYRLSEENYSHIKQMCYNILNCCVGGIYREEASGIGKDLREVYLNDFIPWK